LYRGGNKQVCRRGKVRGLKKTSVNIRRKKTSPDQGVRRYGGTLRMTEEEIPRSRKTYLRLRARPGYPERE